MDDMLDIYRETFGVTVWWDKITDTSKSPMEWVVYEIDEEVPGYDKLLAVLDVMTPEYDPEDCPGVTQYHMTVAEWHAIMGDVKGRQI